MYMKWDLWLVRDDQCTNKQMLGLNLSLERKNWSFRGRSEPKITHFGAKGNPPMWAWLRVPGGCTDSCQWSTHPGLLLNNTESTTTVTPTSHWSQSNSTGRMSIFYFILLVAVPSLVLFCFKFLLLLYHFELFGRHVSQGLWIWTKSVICPGSQRKWPMHNIIVN